MLPNFIVAGVQKSGTTALHNYLVGHPDIFLPEQKETKFFVRDDRYAQGIDSYEREFFGDWSGEKAVGEVDPCCIYFENAATRVAKHLGSPKIIFIFRNPIDRAFSHYIMSYRRGFEKLSFEDALECEEDRICKGYFEKQNYSYRSRGLYFQQVDQFLRNFTDPDVLFLLAEDLARETTKVVRECYEFLGVDPSFRPANLSRRYHEATVLKSVGLHRLVRDPSLARKMARVLVPRKKWRDAIRLSIGAWNQKSAADWCMREETRKKLDLFFQASNNRLASRIARDLSGWQ